MTPGKLRSLVLSAGLMLCISASGQGLGSASAAWGALSSSQKQILAPLQKDWPSLDAQRRQKWLEVASRYGNLPAEEQDRIRERMVEWARMTPAQRAGARLVFQEARQLPADERKARWEAYRALPPETRQALAQRAGPQALPTPPVGRAEPGTATPAPKRNLVQTGARQPPKAVTPTVVQARPGATTTPMATPASPPLHQQAGLPKIAATPTFVDPTTLLPKRGPQGAAARSVAAHEAKPKVAGQP
jgi:hypothetical protein